MINIILMSLTLALLVGGMVGLLLYLTNKERRKLLDKLKIGDTIKFASERYFRGEVLEINENDITVKVKVRKGEIYKNDE